MVLEKPHKTARVYYDKDWKLVEDKSKAIYMDRVVLNEQGHPVVETVQLKKA